MKKILAFIKLLKDLKQLWKYVEAYILNKKQEGQLGKIQDGENKIDQANKDKNLTDEERLKKKAEGVNEIEKNIH